MSTQKHGYISMKKRILFFSLLLFTSSNLFPKVGCSLDALIENMALTGAEIEPRQRISHIINKTGKKVPYLGNQLAARMISAALFAVANNGIFYCWQCTLIDKAKNKVTVARATANIALKTIVTPLATEGIVHYTKKLLHTCSDLFPSVKEKCMRFQKNHPTIAKAICIYGEETYRSNINSVINSGINGLTYNGLCRPVRTGTIDKTGKSIYKAVPHPGITASIKNTRITLFAFYVEL